MLTKGKRTRNNLYRSRFSSIHPQIVGKHAGLPSVDAFLMRCRIVRNGVIFALRHDLAEVAKRIELIKNG
jgi:hypothetical protein